MDGVQENLRPTRSEKTLGALKAELVRELMYFRGHFEKKASQWPSSG